MCKFTLVHAIDCPLGLRKQVIHFIHSCPQLWAFVAFNVQSTSVYCCKFFPCVYIYRPVECTFVSYAFYLESYHSRGTDLYIASWQLAACKCYLEKFYMYTVKKHCMLCCCVSSSMWKKLFKTCGPRFGCTSMSLSVSPCCLWYFRMISRAWKLCKSTLTSTNWKACIFVQWAGLWGQYKEYDRRAVCQLECLMRTKDKKATLLHKWLPTKRSLIVVGRSFHAFTINVDLADSACAKLFWYCLLSPFTHVVSLHLQ